MNIALLGPSGAGKGTQAAKLCPHFGLQHLSTGDLLRTNLATGTPLGVQAREYMHQGELVPDELVAAMLEERVRAIPASQGVLLDGFPRTPEQAGFLDEMFKRCGRWLDAVVYLNVGEEAVLNRLRGRLVCRACHLPYHVQWQRPARAGVCDECGGELQPRPDDHDEIARARWKVFLRHNHAVLNYYQESGRLHLVDGAGTIGIVYAEVVALLGAMQRLEAESTTRVELQLLRAEPEFTVPAAAAVRSDTLNLVLLGAPGSGKGTYAEFLKQHFNLCHVASGDLFRANLMNATQLGQYAKSYMESGELVPDDITEAMIAARLAEIGADFGFLLDGFPRTMPQAQALTEMFANLGRTLGAVLHIRVADETLIQRLASRRSCRGCPASYNLQSRPPARAGVCDRCGGELHQRADDNPNTVRARLKTFHRQTAPLIDSYQRAGLLAELDGEGDIATGNARVLAVVNGVRERVSSSADSPLPAA